MTGSFAASVFIEFDRRDFYFPDNTIFYDRNGKLLRFIPDSKGERHLGVNIEQIPFHVKSAFLAAEDRRFYSHPGFDTLAILRAVKDNVAQGKIVSGASTITQQLVRLVYPKRRSYLNKAIEIIQSIRTELAFSKDEILEQYLNRVPMGGNIVGVELASQAFYGQYCTGITIAQAAVLASLPRAPTFLRPNGKNQAALHKRKDIILRKMLFLGFITQQQYRKALNEKISFRRLALPNHAPHLVDLLIRRDKNTPGPHTLTIDLDFQNLVENVLRSHEKRLAYRRAFQAACLVVHNPTMETLAYVGSLSYSSRKLGYNSGASAKRSAGSTLKPFLYAEALDRGYTAASLFEDTLQNYRTPSGDYRPYNYDRKEYGPVTLRVALSNSLNITAIKMLNQLGSEHFYNLLKQINLINYPKNSPEHYGLGLAVGNLEVTLEQLVAAYALFSNHGLYKPLHYLRSSQDTQYGARIFNEASTYIISDILSDASARTITFGHTGFMQFPFRVAIKTGTSSDYRDAWLIGYTPEYTIGLWVGNFDGSPTFNLSGAEANIPIFKDILNLLYKRRTPASFKVPETVVSKKVCGISGMIPGPGCAYVTEELFIKGTEPIKPCLFHKNEKYHHQLPPSYALWVSNKQKVSHMDNYRLAGLIQIFQKDVSNSEQNQSALINRGKKKRENSSLQSYYKIGSKNNKKYPNNFNLEKTITITYPLNREHFVQTSRETSIELQVRVETLISYVDWFIDGRLICRSAPPYNCIWTMKPGLHRLAAIGPDNQGDSVEITVD